MSDIHLTIIKFVYDSIALCPGPLASKWPGHKANDSMDKRVSQEFINIWNPSSFMYPIPETLSLIH